MLGRFAELRLAAVQRVADPEVLGHIARLSRGKDKGVFRHCSDVLRRQRQGAERVQRTAQLAAALHEMLSHSPLSVSCLLDLQRELQALEDGGEPLAECRILLDQADTRLRQESEARHSLQACKEEAAELAAECTGAACLDAAQLQQWHDRYSALAQRQARLPDWLGGKAAWQQLVASLHQIESRLATLAADNTKDAKFVASFRRTTANIAARLTTITPVVMRKIRKAPSSP